MTIPRAQVRVSGRAILDELVKGHGDPAQLAQLARGRLRVKQDLLHVFRTYKAQTLSMHVGPLETRIRGYNARWKEALQGAIDDLVAEGLMERQGNKMALTEQGKEAVLS